MVRTGSHDAAGRRTRIGARGDLRRGFGGCHPEHGSGIRTPVRRRRHPRLGLGSPPDRRDGSRPAGHHGRIRSAVAHLGGAGALALDALHRLFASSRCGHHDRGRAERSDRLHAPSRGDGRTSDPHQPCGVAGAFAPPAGTASAATHGCVRDAPCLQERDVGAGRCPVQRSRLRLPEHQGPDVDGRDDHRVPHAGGTGARRRGHAAHHPRVHPQEGRSHQWCGPSPRSRGRVRNRRLRELRVAGPEHHALLERLGDMLCGPMQREER